MYRGFTHLVLILLASFLIACGDSGKAINKTVYIELPGSHFRGYAYAIGTVTEEKNGRYIIRIDEIVQGQDSDNEMLGNMRLGRFVQLSPDEVLESKDLPFRISKQRAQVVALNDVVNNALSLSQVPRESMQILKLATDGNGGGNQEIGCVLEIVESQSSTPIYMNYALQLNTAPRGIEQLINILKQNNYFDEARTSIRYADNPDACVSLAVRLVREADFDLRRQVDAMRISDMQQLEQSMASVTALHQALLAFRTDDFRDIPHGQSRQEFFQDKLAALTTDLRRYYAYNYFRDFRHDCDNKSVASPEDVEKRFLQDKESSKVLEQILGGVVLDDRNYNEYQNYYKLNKELPGQMSKDISDDDYYQRALEGFSVVDPTDEQKLMGLEQYLQHFPEGKYVEEARQEIEVLKKNIQQKIESMVPPVPPSPEDLRIEPPPEPEPIPAPR